ncbi:MAG: FecR domain-containing protein [Verrucomicrobiota bacterium]
MKEQTPAMKEARALLESFLDGDRNATDAQRLMALITEDADVRDLYLDQMMLDAQLQEVFVQVEQAGTPASKPSPILVLGPTTKRWLLAAAASLIMAVGIGRWFLPPSYEAPRITGTFTILGGDTIERGATLVTKAQSARVELGGYCDVSLKPNTRVSLAGKEKAERVILEEGTVSCEVDRGVGTFEVETDLGVVSVVGTVFDVDVKREPIGDDLVLKRMAVRVSSGTVRVTAGGRDELLVAGAQESFGEKLMRRDPSEPVEAYHITEEAWDYYWNGDYEMAIKLASHVVERWSREARVLNDGLTAFPTDTAALRTKYVPLNEVGTCYWIMGEAYRKNGDWEGALEAYHTLETDYGFAQCWNHQGWWWKPVEAARKAREKHAP